jgi:hypothetical protein
MIGKKNCLEVMKAFLIIPLAILFLSVSCNRIKPKPPQATTLDTLLPLQRSTLVIPVHYEVSELEETVNSKVKGTFIHEWTRINDKGDSLYIEITKRDEISVSWKGSTLYYSFPIKVSGKFIKSVAGIKVKNRQPINMEIVLHLATKLGFDNKWNLAPQSKLEEIDWVKDPKLNLGVVKLNLRKFVENAIEKNKDDLIPKLDETLSKLLKTRNTISKIWDDIQKPIRVNKKETQVWLKAYADEITAKLTDSEPGAVTLDVELKAWLQLVVDGQSMPMSNERLPDYKRKENSQDSIQIFILARVPYKQVNKILAKELEGKKLSSQGYSTTIKKIKIYGTAEDLAVDLKVSGDVSGRIYARAKLHYDSLTSMLSTEDFHFDVDSENILVNSADWLLHDNAIGIVSEELKLNVKPYAEMLPELIVRGIEKGKTGDKIDLNISTLNVILVQHIYTDRDIQFIFKAQGRADIGLEKKIFAKKIKASNISN